MKKALVTGGNGFVGKHLVSLLEARGSVVAVLSQNQRGHVGGTKFYEADIRDREEVCSALRDFGPDHIYHLAAVSSVDEAWRSPRFTYDVKDRKSTRLNS